MINLDDETAQSYLDGCNERLAAMEADLLAIKRTGAEIDGRLVDRALQAARWIQTGAGFLNNKEIGELAGQAEDMLARIRSRALAPTPDQVAVLLRGIDSLRELVQQAGDSNQAGIVGVTGPFNRPLKADGPDAAAGRPAARRLRVLLAEDDFASRMLLQSFLSRYGECHVAVNGREAVETFRYSLERGERYDLICMDIMMPEMDGREAVRQIRALEEEHGILSTGGAKIIMTTAVDEVREVFRCFTELCDAYLTKPIDLGMLRSRMKSYELIQ